MLVKGIFPSPSYAPFFIKDRIDNGDIKVEYLHTKSMIADYLTKPFNNTLLLSKTETILENRQKLQDRFSKTIVLEASEISISSAEEDFLIHLQKVSYD